MNLVKFLVLNFFIGAFLLPTIAIAQSDVKETVQINIEGSELTKFTVEVDGNNILINLTRNQIETFRTRTTLRI